jgi:hypothetical protein
MNRHAWAIKLNNLDRPEALAGVYYFTMGHDIPDFLDGVRIALFRTREEARARCRKIYTGGLGRRPEVIKVAIAIQEAPYARR